MRSELVEFGALFCLGIVLVALFQAVARPNAKAILLVPLVLPVFLWAAIGHRMGASEMPDAAEAHFLNIASAPVERFTDTSALSPESTLTAVPRLSPTAEAASSPAESEISLDYGALGASAVTRGDQNGRFFLWFLYSGLDPLQLEQALAESWGRLAEDPVRQYLVFGPQVGRIDCYLRDDDAVFRTGDVLLMLRAMGTARPETWPEVLRDSTICTAPFDHTMPAINTLSRLAQLGQDEGIVVDDDGVYVGLASRDRIVSQLLQALTAAAPTAP
ncbi:MAG: hypothetical protein CMM50_00950 [Rhodospirillaceae bacterium]|nr:hypothetical protein [Rhodospirillaceae bacterium]